MSKKKRKKKDQREVKRRNSVVHPFHGLVGVNEKTGVGFEFGKSTLSKNGKQELDYRLESIKPYILNTKHKVILHGYASRPGSESSNYNLSIARAENVKAYIIEKLDINPNRIDVEGFGEQEYKTTLAEEFQPNDNIDNLINRIVTIGLETVIEKPEISEFAEMAIERIDNLKEDYTEGRDLFKDLVEPYADLIAKQVSLPDNIVGDAPYDNPSVLWEQVKGKGKEAKGGYIKLLAKYVAGSIIDMANANYAGDVAAARVSLYEALTEAIAAGIDKSYNPNLSNMTTLELELYNSLKEDISSLSKHEKYLIGAFLVGKARGSLLFVQQLTSNQIINFFNGVLIRYGADLQFDFTRYRINTTYDEAGLEIKEENGNIEILDPRETEDTSTIDRKNDTEQDFSYKEESGNQNSFNVIEAGNPDSFNMFDESNEFKAAMDEIGDDVDNEGGTEQDFFNVIEAGNPDSFNMFDESGEFKASTDENRYDGENNNEDGKDDDDSSKADDEPNKDDDEPNKDDDEPNKDDDEPNKADDEPNKDDDEPNKDDDESNKDDDEPNKDDDELDAEYYEAPPA